MKFNQLKSNMRLCLGAVALLCPFFVNALAMNSALNDPYLWLEDVQGEKALAWVRDRNAVSTAQLQAEARLTSLFRTTYMLSYKNLGGVGELPLAAGGQRRLLTNFGIDWTGVWSTK